MAFVDSSCLIFSSCLKVSKPLTSLPSLSLPPLFMKFTLLSAFSFAVFASLNLVFVSFFSSSAVFLWFVKSSTLFCCLSILFSNFWKFFLVLSPKSKIFIASKYLCAADLFELFQFSCNAAASNFLFRAAFITTKPVAIVPPPTTNITPFPNTKLTTLPAAFERLAPKPFSGPLFSPCFCSLRFTFPYLA